MHTLQPLRESGYLTHTNKNKIIQRPITIVVTGSAPFHRVLSNPYHDIFYDAPLHDLSGIGHDATSSSDPNPSPYTTLNSYYASTNFHRSIGSLLLGGLSGDQIAKIRGQIHQAHERGLKVRYWGTPGWPVALRNYVWRILVGEGVDVLNVDDLRDASKGDWRGGVGFGVGAWW